MVADKTVFFGALFDFHPTACDELIKQFKESLGNEDSTFISYDKPNKAFTFTVNRHDDKLVSLFAGHIKTYIDEQAELGSEPYQSPRIRPFDGTTLQNSLLDEVRLDDGTEGLLAISNDSSDEAEMYAMPGHINAYWKPEREEITILTKELADSLVQLTGCSFFPDYGANQVGISGVNFNIALSKLQNLEKLQTLLASHRSAESSKATANVLMLAKPEQNIAIQFLPLTRDTRPYERIIVSEQSQIRLDNKCVGELRYTHNRTEHSTPLNLLDPPGTAENRPFSIWTGFTSLQMGQRGNLQPRRLFGNTSKMLSALHPHSSSTSALPASLLPPTETRKIESWAENIDEAVNPNEIAVERPKELTGDEIKIGRQRRLASVDSDSENEPVVTVRSSPPTTVDRAGQPVEEGRPGVDESSDQDHDQPFSVPNDSADDIEFSQRPAANPQIKTGRRRRVQAADSDDSSDSELPFVTTKDALETGQAISNAFQEEVHQEATSTTPRGRGTSTRFNSRVRGMSSRLSTRGSQSNLPNLPKRGRGGQCALKQETRSPSQTRGQNPSTNVSRGGQQPARGQAIQLNRFHSPFIRGRGNAGSIRNPRSSDKLINIGQTIDTSLVKPPPGLNIKFESSETSFESANLLDEPLHNTPRPPIPAVTSSWVTTPPNTPLPAGRSSLTSASSGRFYVNTFNPRPNVTAMEEEQLQMLLSQRDRLVKGQDQASDSRNELGSNNTGLRIPSSSVANSTVSSSEYRAPYSSSARVQPNDEFSTRSFHRTMGQGAPNPGKKKKEETKKERQARIAKAKVEAHGDLPVAKKSEKPSPKIGSSSDEVDKGISLRKRQLLKNSNLVSETDQAAADEGLRQGQTKMLIESLMPLFEAGRAFSGKLRFEVQFGQVINSLSSLGGQYHQLIDLHEWERRFHPQLGKLPEVTSFTNVLTTNGADADRILEMKSPGPGSITVWSKVEPIPRAISYEFQCQTKDNEEFWLVVDQDGTFDIRPASTTIGIVNLHFPGQIWDACVVIAGFMNHHFAKPVKDAVQTFVSSLYIPPGLKKISITYRLPDANMTIRNLVMKRKSVHSCNLPGKDEFQLYITEVQTLYHQFHKDDKKLAQGFVKDYSQMINDGRLHYEVSLVHKEINKLLEQNVGLELGELARGWTETDIISKEDIRSTVDLTTLIVSKIDGIGSKNIGTLFRRDVEQMVEEKQQMLDPAPIGGTALSRLNPGATSHIPGVRGGKAHIFWQNGRPYAYGYGGASVPIPDPRGSGSDEVVPDDSASQAEQAGAQIPTRSAYPAQAATVSTSVQPRTGNSFW